MNGLATSGFVSMMNTDGCYMVSEQQSNLK